MMHLFDEQRLGDNVELVEGDVCETLPEWLASRQETSFTIVNVDLDLYEPTKVAIECLFPRVARGGSWALPPDKCRSASRIASHEDWKEQDPQIPKSIWYHTDADFVGIRLVCEPPPVNAK